MNVSQAFIRFKGWATIRLPTDPDPADEPRGASGYTYAFAGEPDLDRIIRLQPEEEPAYLRPGAPWPWGVDVYDAFILDPLGQMQPVDLGCAPVRFHGGAKLENRNWLFTLPGWEPIVPFDLSVGDPPNGLRRTAPLTPDDQPAYQVPTATLMAQGATGANLEPETIGTATGIWDSLAMLRQRAQVLLDLIEAEKEPVRRTCLRARYGQVRYALDNPNDRRVMARYAVERFDVTMTGPEAVVPSQGPLAGLDPTQPWSVAFYLGGWDFDVLGAWFEGCLQVPFRPQGD